MLGDICSVVQSICRLRPGQKAPPNTTTSITLRQLPDGTWDASAVDCDVPTANGPGPADARDEITKLVPRPGIGIAPPGGATLVNIQTLFWVDTTATRNLGTVQLLGKKVQLQVRVTSVAWDFGDGGRDTTDNPGRPYDSTDPCTTALCPQYFGHIYRTTGPRTVTATTTWTGRYRVGNGAWQTIATAVTGPPQTLTLTVEQARAVLVPTPTGG